MGVLIVTPLILTWAKASSAPAEGGTIVLAPQSPRDDTVLLTLRLLPET